MATELQQEDCYVGWRVSVGDGDDYGGRLIYLKEYSEGAPVERIYQLKSAIENLLSK